MTARQYRHVPGRPGPAGTASAATALTAPPGGDTARQQRAAAWWITALLLVVLVIDWADKGVLGLAAVPIMKDLHLSPAQFGFAVTGAIVGAQPGPGGYSSAMLLTGVLMLAGGVLACIAIRPPRDAAALRRAAPAR